MDGAHTGRGREEGAWQGQGQRARDRVHGCVVVVRERNPALHSSGVERERQGDGEGGGGR